MENESTLNLLRQASSAALQTGRLLDTAPHEGQSAFAREHLQNGLSLYTRGRIPEALWEFFEAAGDEPSDPLSHYLSGLALQALGLGEQAHAEWRAVLTLTQSAKARHASGKDVRRS